MRGSWRVVLAVLAVAVIAALVYTLGTSVRQMRALLNDTPVVPPPTAPEVVTPPRAATVPASNESSAALDVGAGDSAAPDETQDAQRSESPEPETEVETFPAGPPSGAEFAELLEGELAGEADPAAIEELRRALREAGPAEQ